MRPFESENFSLLMEKVEEQRRNDRVWGPPGERRAGPEAWRSGRGAGPLRAAALWLCARCWRGLGPRRGPCHVAGNVSEEPHAECGSGVCCDGGHHASTLA